MKTKGGRVYQTLIALLTRNRLALIIRVRIQIIYNRTNNNPYAKRFIRDLKLSAIGFPLALVIMWCMGHCSGKAVTENDTPTEKIDSCAVCGLSSQPHLPFKKGKKGCIAHPPTTTLN